MLSWLNRRVPNGTHGGVRGRNFSVMRNFSYSIYIPHTEILLHFMLVYGFIVITEIDNKFIGYVLQASKRLIKSGQIDILIETAKDLTEKAVADEFGD